MAENGDFRQGGHYPWMILALRVIGIGGLLLIESEQFLLNEFCQPFIARIAIALTP